MWSLSDDVHRRAGEPHSLGHHSNVPFMDPALYMLRLSHCTLHHTDDVCAMRRKWRESCRRPLDLASARSRRQYVDMWGMQMHKCLRSIMPVTQTAVSAADAWGRDSVPCGVPWHRSVCRGVVCGDLGAGLSGPALAGGLAWSCWTIPVALYARVRPIARVEVPERVSMRTSPRLQNIRRWVRAEARTRVHFRRFEPCHVFGCFEHAKRS